MSNMIVFGATSAIAQQCIRLYAADGWGLFLVGRNADKLQTVADDALARGAARVEQAALDLNELDRHAALIDDAIERLGGLDIALIAHGTLSDQPACQASVQQTLAEINTNLVGPLSLLTLLANVFERNRAGSIVVISSVAGDRGRQSNYVYGAAKGGLTVFLQGLRNRLQRSGVQVLTVKPGFVDTPMTAEFDKGALWASAADIAAGIRRAVDKRRDVAYLPWFWRPIMWTIRTIPEFVFKRLSL